MFEFFFKYPLAVFRKGDYVLQSGWPLWVWAVIALAAAVGLAWVLLRHAGATWTRGRLAVLWLMQASMVALLLLLLWQPGLSVSTLKQQQNVVAVLLDDSKSMAFDDAGGTRKDALTRTLQSGLADNLKKRFQVRYYRMGGQLERVEDWKGLTAAAPATRIGDALKQISAEAGSLPIGAVVLMSDGSDTSGGIDRESITAIRSRQIPVHTVGFGREKFKKDIALADVQVAARALADSRLTAAFSLRQQGYAGQRVRITVEEAGKVLASRELTLGADGTAQAETLLFNAGAAGVRSLKASVQTLGGEENLANNSAMRLVQVDARKPRVLYFDGEPRWEFKFIRRALEDDKSLDLVTMLRTTQNKIYRQGVKNATELEAGFPATPDELFGFEGLIIGSVEASYFSSTQQDLIQQFADRRGGGVLFLGGRYAMAEGGYGASPLLNMMPVNPGERRTTFVRDRATVELTAAGRESLITRMEEDPAKNVERWKKLPFLADYQNPGTVKPGALTLVDMITPAGRMPMFVIENYGRGRTAVLATQGTWRWQMQQPLEDKSHEMFWQQVVRWVAGPTPGQVVATTPDSEYDDEVKVPLRADVRNKLYMPLGDAQVEARITGPDGAVSTVPLQPDPAAPGIYKADYAAEKPGSYLSEIIATRAGEPVGRDAVSFRRADGVSEAIHAEQNRELLETLSRETGGQYFQPGGVSKLADEISYSEAGINTREVKDLWNMPILFLLLASLRGGEWLLRRRWGAV